MATQDKAVCGVEDGGILSFLATGLETQSLFVFRTARWRDSFYSIAVLVIPLVVLGHRGWAEVR